MEEDIPEGDDDDNYSDDDFGDQPKSKQDSVAAPGAQNNPRASIESKKDEKSNLPIFLQNQGKETKNDPNDRFNKLM